jgi:uncharacterized membrane protein YqjE
MNDTRSIGPTARVENHQCSLRELVREILDELKEFAATRLLVMKSELQETMASVKVAVPISLVALVFLFTGFLLLTAASVAIVAHAFAGGSYAWFFALVIIGVVWTSAGAIAAFFAYNEFRSKGRFPKTVEVIKADRAWLQSEARG